MIVILHCAIYLQPRLRFFAGLQMKNHPIPLRRENIVEVIYTKCYGCDHTKHARTTSAVAVAVAAAKKILTTAYKKDHRENKSEKQSHKIDALSLARNHGIPSLIIWR